MIFHVLEFVTSALVIMTLFLIPRGNRWWVAYSANSILFSVVSLYFGRYWFALMGLCLFITAVRNYVIGKKKEDTDEAAYHEGLIRGSHMEIPIEKLKSQI